MLRRLLSLLALVASLGITAAAAVEVVKQGIPAEPAAGVELRGAGTATTRALRGELLSPDLAAKSRAEKLQVVASLERQALAGDKLPGLADLNEDQRRRLEANLAALGQAWLLDAVDAYFSLKGEDRDVFLDGMVDRLLDIQTQASLNGGANELLSKVYGLRFGGIKRQFENWRKSASPLEQLRVASFVVALQKRFSERFDLPAGNGPPRGFHLRRGPGR